MIPHRAGPLLGRRFVPALVVACLASAHAAPPEDSPADDEAARATEAATWLQGMVDGMQVRSADGELLAWQPDPTPRLKFSDPARGIQAGGVWRLGAEGRPQGFVAMERTLLGRENAALLSHEFVSLTTENFELWSGEQPTTWRPDGTALEFSPLAANTPPAAAARQRLQQMRAHARRFAVSETLVGDATNLRLMPQPIDRYQGEGIVDGAVFAWTYGTNPELLLLLECHEEGWRYALTRLSAAEVVVELDGGEVARFDELGQFMTSGAYQTFRQRAADF